MPSPQIAQRPKSGVALNSRAVRYAESIASPDVDGLEPRVEKPAKQHHIEVAVSRPTFYKNILHIRESVAPSRVCVVLKSNAYGHGLAALAPVAVTAGADYLGICTNPEAAAIRALGIDVPLLRLRMGLREELDEAVQEYGVEEQVGTLAAAEYLSALGRQLGRDLPVHINIDTGMGRSGFFVEQIDLIRRVIGMAGLKVGGHLHPLSGCRCGRLATDSQNSRDRSRTCARSWPTILPDDV